MKTVKLVGVDWCMENLTDEHGRQHFTHEEAMELTKNKSVRLPTKEEFDALCDLPSKWDGKLRGRWFAETESDLKNEEKSLFLPATGYLNHSNATLNYMGRLGYYWSSAVNGIYSYYLYFGSGNVTSAYNYYVRGCSLSVRCVKINPFI